MTSEGTCGLPCPACDAWSATATVVSTSSANSPFRQARDRPVFVVSPTLVLRACNSFKQRRGRWNGWITPAIPYLGCHGMQEASCA